MGSRQLDENSKQVLRAVLQPLHGSTITSRLFSRLDMSGVWRAPSFLMKIDFVVTLSFLLAILFIGSLGAFLLYVPTLSVFTTVIMLIGLGLMFALGLQTGRHRRRPSLINRNLSAK
jgi:hypothetical protein